MVALLAQRGIVRGGHDRTSVPSPWTITSAFSQRVRFTAVAAVYASNEVSYRTAAMATPVAPLSVLRISKAGILLLSRLWPRLGNSLACENQCVVIFFPTITFETCLPEPFQPRSERVLQARAKEADGIGAFLHRDAEQFHQLNFENAGIGEREIRCCWFRCCARAKREDLRCGHWCVLSVEGGLSVVWLRFMRCFCQGRAAYPALNPRTYARASGPVLNRSIGLPSVCT